MGRAAADGPPTIEWSVHARPLPGQNVSGDLHVVVTTTGGVVAAAIDGLGHGPEAANAAALAAEIVADHAEWQLVDLLKRCHTEMRRSRGAAMSVASFDPAEGTMTWIGVGNVEGVLFRADPDGQSERETLLLRGGVVGHQLPPLRSATLAVAPGDTLIFATDGIANDFRQQPAGGRPAEEIGADILDRYAKPIDDALVLVARYAGVPS